MTKRQQQEKINRDQRRPTSHDVARMVGVSQSTVSLVYSHKAEGRVSKKTQDAIFEAAREIGYQPNALGRAFRLGTASTIALVVPDLFNPYFPSLLRGAQRKAHQYGYVVVLVETENDPNWQEGFLQTFSVRAFDGFILAAVFHPDRILADSLKRKAVILDSTSEDISTINIDNQRAILTLMEHLYDLGHRKIGFVRSQFEKFTFDHRRKAYTRFLDSVGLPLRSEYVIQVPYTRDVSCDAVLNLLRSADPPTALVCEQDYLAVGVYKAAETLKLQIPDDLSVVGFDDTVFAEILEPGLTSISVPAEEIGSRAVETVIGLIQDNGEIRHDVYPVELSVRGSTTAMRIVPG